MTTASAAAASARPRAARAVRALPAWALGGLLALYAAVAAFAAVVLPYSSWDSLYFGAWSRLIADGSFHADGVGPEQLHRPLFYVLQGLVWAPFGVHEAAGRLLSLAFSVLLCWTLYALARRGGFAPLEALVPVLLVAAVPAFAGDVAAGLTDIPVAALLGATALAASAAAGSRAAVGATALLALATVLAKPSGLLGIAGLVVAAAIGSRNGLRTRLTRVVIPLAAGAAVALAYDLAEAQRLGISLHGYLTAGTGNYYADLASSVRGEVLVGGRWLGPDLRLPLAFGLLYAVLRVARADARRAAGGAAAGAALATWLLPSLASGGGTLGAGPFAGGLDLHDAVYLLELAALPLTLLARDGDAPSARTLARLLAWAAPGLVGWIAVSVYAERLLSVAWPPLILLCALPFALALAGVRRHASAAAPMVLVPLALAVLLALPAINGLGATRWRELRDAGPAGWSDAAQMRNFALGSFADELEAVRAQDDDPSASIVSSDGKLRFAYGRRLDYGAPSSCGDLRGSRVFVLLLDPDSLAQNGGRAVDDWLRCRTPPLHLVAEMPSTYAVFVVGAPPRVRPTPHDCRVPAPPAGIVAVFGSGLSHPAAEALRARAVEVGYADATVERRGCESYAVVVPGYSSMDEEGGVRSEAATVDLHVHFEERP